MVVDRVQPFFHMLTTGIIAHVGEDNPEAVIATTMVAFCLSSILTGGFLFVLCVIVAHDWWQGLRFYCWVYSSWV